MSSRTAQTNKTGAHRPKGVHAGFRLVLQGHTADNHVFQLRPALLSARHASQCSESFRFSSRTHASAPHPAPESTLVNQLRAVRSISKVAQRVQLQQINVARQADITLGIRAPANLR